MFNSSLNNALTRANSNIISGYSMPSDTYDNLTLGASGSTYTAPANGWFVIVKKTTGSQYVFLLNHNTHIQQNSNGASGTVLRTYIPAKKNDVVECNYSAAGALERFNFIYALGSESEA